MNEIDEEQPEDIATPMGAIDPLDPLVRLAARIPKSVKFDIQVRALRENVTLGELLMRAIKQYLAA